MELWIRSQKNEKLRPLLLKVNEIEIGDYDDDMDCIVVNNLHCVGIYKSKERALQVLDEIQNILKPIIKINYEYDDSQPIMNGEWLKPLKEESKIEELSTYVYEMPKE